MRRLQRLLTGYSLFAITLTTWMSSATGQTLQPATQPAGVSAISDGLTEPVPIGGDTIPDSATPAPFKFTARYLLEQGATSGYLILQCELPTGSYIHSLTQSGNLNPSKITFGEAIDFAVSEPFQPDLPPTIIENDPVFQQRLEKHFGTVQFFVPIDIRPGSDLNLLKPVLIFEGQVCSDAGVCMPLRNHKVKADFAGYFDRTPQTAAELDEQRRIESSVPPVAETAGQVIPATGYEIK